MSQPDAATEPTRRTVAVALPDDAGEPVVVSVAVAAPAPVAAPATRPRKPRTTPPPRPEPDLGPDIPIEPLPAGALIDMLVDTGQVTPESLPEVERKAWESRQRAQAPERIPDAALTVADAVPALRRLLADPDISAADAAALVLALSRVTDAARDAPSSKPLSELTRSELAARVADCDTRRAQLLAAIAAAGGAAPHGGRGIHSG